jgi:hypothetical protein
VQMIPFVYIDYLCSATSFSVQHHRIQDHSLSYKPNDRHDVYCKLPTPIDDASFCAFAHELREQHLPLSSKAMPLQEVKVGLKPSRSIVMQWQSMPSIRLNRHLDRRGRRIQLP